MLNDGVNREYQQRVFYKGTIGSPMTYGIGGYTLRRDSTAGTEGVGASARITFAPLPETGRVLHFAASYSYENPADAQVSSGTPTPVNGLLANIRKRRNLEAFPGTVYVNTTPSHRRG